MLKDKRSMLSALVADHKGNIFDLDGYAAVGRLGQDRFYEPLSMDNVVPLPPGSELMYLPDRHPVLYNISKRKIEVLRKNPFNEDKPLYPVAVFNSPGFVVTHTCTYEENSGSNPLPLFSYGAVALNKDRFYSAAIQVEWEPRQDLRLMPIKKIRSGIVKFQKKMGKNRLREHLEKCALVYGCPAAKNLFLGRYEAPLPTSQACNARCVGCISLQKEKGLSCCQERISFTPSPQEISEIALEHINRVKKAVVSFGQGCEGEPLLASEVIEPAIGIIRSKTRQGTINLNTNASRPDLLEKLFKAGLDSIRISINSFQKEYYEAYFRPNGYNFFDLFKCIDLAERFEKFVSINYLNLPGVTDSPLEVEALLDFLKKNKINMIQWRNLNIDPLYYYKVLKVCKNKRPYGMKHLLEIVKKEYPEIKFGYFNPPVENF